MKKPITVYVVMVALFTFAVTPVAEAHSKFNCSTPGISCQGADLHWGWYNNGTNPLWVNADSSDGYDFEVRVSNSATSKHTIYFWWQNSYGVKSKTYTATPGQGRVISQYAGIDGYWVLHMQCGSTGSNTDCEGTGKISTW